jgi:hypothetical protein
LTSLLIAALEGWSSGFPSGTLADVPGKAS